MACVLEDKRRDLSVTPEKELGERERRKSVEMGAS